jgi:hypothetical protein
MEPVPQLHQGQRDIINAVQSALNKQEAMVRKAELFDELLNLLKQADALLGVDCKGQSACENVASLKSNIAQLIKSIEVA